MKFYFPKRDNLISLALVSMGLISLFWLADWGQSFFNHHVERNEARLALLVLMTAMFTFIFAHILLKAPTPVIEISDLGVTDVRLNAATLPWSEIENIELFKEGSMLCKQSHVLIHMRQDFTPIIKPQILLGLKIPHKPVKPPFIIRKNGFSTHIEDIYSPMLRYWNAAKSK